jgi:hypothetical protein
MPALQNIRLNGGFGQCTSTVMRDPSVGIRDKALYAYLCTYADSHTNTLTASVFRMADELGVCKQTILRSLKQLENQKIISRVFRGRGQSKITIILK